MEAAQPPLPPPSHARTRVAVHLHLRGGRPQLRLAQRSAALHVPEPDGAVQGCAHQRLGEQGTGKRAGTVRRCAIHQWDTVGGEHPLTHPPHQPSTHLVEPVDGEAGDRPFVRVSRPLAGARLRRLLAVRPQAVAQRQRCALSHDTHGVLAPVLHRGERAARLPGLQVVGEDTAGGIAHQRKAAAEADGAAGSGRLRVRHRVADVALAVAPLPPPSAQTWIGRRRE